MTKEGKLLFVSASCSPVRSEGDEAQGVVVVFRDIDRIKNMEVEIQKERNNLQSVLASLSLASCSLIHRASCDGSTSPF
jgi:hypothetical protein